MIQGIKSQGTERHSRSALRYRPSPGRPIGDAPCLESGQALAKWTGTKLTYFHTDHLGTIIRGTHGSGVQDNSAGNPASAGDEVFQDFSTPFGMQPTAGWHGVGDSGFDPATGLGSNCGVTGFTTHVKDCESGLQYMQARYYDPVLSRFTSVDPVDYLSDGRTGMVNRYSYTLNDPVNGVDPDGRAVVPIFRAAAKKIVKKEVKKRAAKAGGMSENGEMLLDLALSGGDLNSMTSIVAERVIGKVGDKVKSAAKAHSAAKRRAAREAQRKHGTPTSRSGEQVQGSPGEPRHQIKEGSSGQDVGVVDGSRDAHHDPHIEVGNMKQGEQLNRYGQPRIVNDKEKVEIE